MGGAHRLQDVRPAFAESLGDSLAPVRLDGAVQETEVREGATIHPATFKGTATLATRDGERKLEIGHANVRLVSAGHCP